MLFLNESHIEETGIDWDKTIGVIRDTISCLAENDFAQPVKPYLRYRNVKNRIIAMPAFVGGSINMAGIKWIASFPGNIDKGLPRAHSVVILNDGDTGEPLGVICTPLLSIIRTASVSGLVIKYFDAERKPATVTIGITGFGPIGRYHLKMCLALLGDKIDRVFIYDIRGADISGFAEDLYRIEIVSSWDQAYFPADIFITCTVSDQPYIDKKPRDGSLHLNVSLRDYKSDVFGWFADSIIVDDWDEVCRERTDIERMHTEKGLRREDTRSIIDLVQYNCLGAYDPRTPILFNPMGMAVFDIAIGNYYYKAEGRKIKDRLIGLQA